MSVTDSDPLEFFKKAIFFILPCVGKYIDINQKCRDAGQTVTTIAKVILILVIILS